MAGGCWLGRGGWRFDRGGSEYRLGGPSHRFGGSPGPFRGAAWRFGVTAARIEGSEEREGAATLTGLTTAIYADREFTLRLRTRGSRVKVGGPHRFVEELAPLPGGAAGQAQEDGGRGGAAGAEHRLDEAGHDQGHPQDQRGALGNTTW